MCAAQCISDDYSPEEESNIKLRSVGKAQEGIRAYVSNSRGTTASSILRLTVGACAAACVLQVQDPEGRTLFDNSLTAQVQDVAIPEEQYGMYRICIRNSGMSREGGREYGALPAALTLLLLAVGVPGVCSQGAAASGGVAHGEDRDR